MNNSCSLVSSVCLMVRVRLLGNFPIKILGLLSTSVRKRIRVEELEVICK